MGFWLFVLLISTVVVFIKIFNLRRDYENTIKGLQRDIQEFRTRISTLEADERSAFPSEEKSELEREETPTSPVIPAASPVPPPSPMPEGPEVEPPPITLTPSGLPAGHYPPFAPETPEEEESPAPAPVTPSPVPSYAAAARVDLSSAAAAPEPAAPSGPSLMDRWEQFKANVDWELFTGVKLFAWLGGLALFIGAGFFVKYSIDRNLIPPALRLAISAVIGLALIVFSARISKERFTVLRHTLGAGGIGVLYSVVFAATLYYHYLSNPVGFGLLSVVSATAFVLAVFFRGIPISVLGALGAYLTPILVSTGQGSLAGRDRQALPEGGAVGARESLTSSRKSIKGQILPGC